MDNELKYQIENNSQVNWIIRSKSAKIKKYRTMVVGWQNVTYTINALIEKFNQEFFKKMNHKSDHYQMHEIAIKKLIIASLFELRTCINNWYRALQAENLLTEKIKKDKVSNRQIINRINKYRDIRNSISFHFGDPNLNPRKLIELYKKVDEFSFNELNLIWKSSLKLGESLKKIILKNV